MFLNVECYNKYYQLFCFGNCPTSWVKNKKKQKYLETGCFIPQVSRLLLVWPL
jgi:hypothetical protein